MKKKLFLAGIGLLVLFGVKCDAVAVNLENVSTNDKELVYVASVEGLQENPAYDFDYTISEEGVTIAEYLGERKDVVIPEKIDGYTVTSIEAGAFMGCGVTSVKISSGITCIVGYTFRGCSELTDIDVPDSVTRIESYAFAGCSSLTSVKIPNGVTSIESYSFDGCSNLKYVEISDSVTRIESYAFAECRSITHVEIPNSVTYIGDYAFYFCSRLTNIEIPDSVTSIGERAFYYCMSLTDIEIPDGVTSISNGLFDCCYNLASVKIPDSVTSIGEGALNHCHELTDVRIPDGITTIGDSTFEYCFNLTSIEIPDSVTSIGNYAFRFCDSLSGIDIPDGVTDIGIEAFLSCDNLTYIKIPKTVTYIGEYALGYGYSEDIDDLEIIYHDFFPIEGFVIYGEKGSYAQTYANNNDITFISITVNPKALTVFEGYTVTYAIQATGKELSYQWQKSSDGGKTWVNSSSTGAKTAKLSITTKLSYTGLQFRCVITDHNGNKIASSAVKLIVKDAGPTIMTQPTNQSVTVGQTVNFKIEAIGEELTYQWQKSTNGVDWVNSGSAGAKTNELSMTAKISYNGLKFRCVMTNRSGKKKISSTVKLTVKAADPTIATQPTAQSVTTGQAVSFKIAAKGDGLTYQWQKSTNGGETWVNSGSTGAKSDTLSMTAKISFNGLQFRCIVTDKYGQKVTSSAVVLTVKAAGPTITTQPTAQSVTTGQPVSFKVVAEGDGLTYQWQKSSNGGETWVNSGSTGAKTDTLSMTAKLSFNGLQFRCVVTDQNGKKATSSAVVLSVNK